MTDCKSCGGDGLQLVGLGDTAPCTDCAGTQPAIPCVRCKHCVRTHNPYRTPSTGYSCGVNPDTPDPVTGAKRLYKCWSIRSFALTDCHPEPIGWFRRLMRWRW